MLRMNAVVIPTVAPMYQPTYPRIVAPTKEKSLPIWNGRLAPVQGTLRYDCFLGVHRRPCPGRNQEVDQADKGERPPQAWRHYSHLSVSGVEDERQQPEQNRGEACSTQTRPKARTNRSVGPNERNTEYEIHDDVAGNRAARHHLLRQPRLERIGLRLHARADDECVCHEIDGVENDASDEPSYHHLLRIHWHAYLGLESGCTCRSETVFM